MKDNTVNDIVSLALIDVANANRMNFKLDGTGNSDPIHVYLDDSGTIMKYKGESPSGSIFTFEAIVPNSKSTRGITSSKIRSDLISALHYMIALLNDNVET